MTATLGDLVILALRSCRTVGACDVELRLSFENVCSFVVSTDLIPAN